MAVEKRGERARPWGGSGRGTGAVGKEEKEGERGGAAMAVRVDKVARVPPFSFLLTCLLGQGRSRVGDGGCQVGTAGSVERLGLEGPSWQGERREGERERRGSVRS